MSQKCLVISSSLNPDSKSRIMAKEAFSTVRKHGAAEFLDLAQYSLPMCDGDAVYSHPHVLKITAMIENANAILLAVPVYNYAASASAKNLIELTGSAWSDKIVGFLCAAGGKSSYMSILGLANSLMLDFRCIINPRFVYAEGSSFNGDEISDEKILTRIKELVESTYKLTGQIISKAAA
jgi:NAD(P)H-dependent FMN reductase